jgi:hypothetical protein
MSWAAVAGAVVGAVGSMANSGSGGINSSSLTAQQMIDPRMADYLYGNGLGGLLGGVNNLYNLQNSQGGLNPMQTAGLEMQRQTLMSPGYTQGYDAMRSMGMGLMGQGAAGNPFSGGSTAMPSGVTQPNMGNRTGPDMTIMPVTRSGDSSLGFNPMSAAYQPIQMGTAAPQSSPYPGGTDFAELLRQIAAQHGPSDPGNPLFEPGNVKTGG